MGQRNARAAQRGSVRSKNADRITVMVASLPARARHSAINATAAVSPEGG